MSKSEGSIHKGKANGPHCSFTREERVSSARSIQNQGEKIVQAFLKLVDSFHVFLDKTLGISLVQRVVMDDLGNGVVDLLCTKFPPVVGEDLVA